MGHAPSVPTKGLGTQTEPLPHILDSAEFGRLRHAPGQIPVCARLLKQMGGVEGAVEMLGFEGNDAAVEQAAWALRSICAGPPFAAVAGDPEALRRHLVAQNLRSGRGLSTLIYIF